LVDICGYELPTNVQNFTQKDLTKVKIFLKVLGGLLILKHPVGQQESTFSNSTAVVTGCLYMMTENIIVLFVNKNIYMY